MYKAVVARIHTKPHPGADRLQLGIVSNYQVIVSMETQDGELGLFFGADGQLSPEFAEANDLIMRVDEKGNKAGGYFGKDRRVKAQNFRKEKSEGFYCPLSFLNFVPDFDVTSLKEGDLIDEINGIRLCNKYYTPKTLKAMGAKTGKLRRANIRFPKHFDTHQLRKDIDKIKPGSILYFTYKLHGTSARNSYVLDDKVISLNFFQRLRRFIAGEGFEKTKIVSTYEDLIGTRNTVLRSPDQKGYYESESFRYEAAKPFIRKLRKSEVIFSELVGYTSTGLIMQAQSTEKLNDKRVSKLYGPQMIYKYNCIEGQHKLFVYRIAITNDDGEVFDLSWPMVKKRCFELRVEHVPEVPGYERFIYDGDKEKLIKDVEQFMNKPAFLDRSHVEEGICVRVESEDGTSFYKYKSHLFCILEGFQKDDNNYLDLEEIS